MLRQKTASPVRRQPQRAACASFMRIRKEHPNSAKSADAKTGAAASRWIRCPHSRTPRLSEQCSSGSFRKTYSSRLSPRTAAILGPLLNGLLRIIESTEFEQRLAKIERRLEEGLNQSDTSVPKMREKNRATRKGVSPGTSILKPRPPDERTSWNERRPSCKP